MSPARAFRSLPFSRGRVSIDRSAPVLLFQGDYYGTLAVARALGRAGVAVTLADAAPPDALVGLALRAPQAPSVPGNRRAGGLPRLARRLRRAGAGARPRAGQRRQRFGSSRATPLAWRRAFACMHRPSRRSSGSSTRNPLHAAAEAAGLAVPVADPDEPRRGPPPRRLPRLPGGPEAALPGVLVLRREGRARRVPAMPSPAPSTPSSEGNTFGREALAAEPNLKWPMVQEYFPRAEGGIYGLSGFLGRDGKPMIRGPRRKVLQRPRRFGIGVCFEAVAVDDTLAAALRRLFEATGYFGIFEAELVEAKGCLHLIDMNPRPYSQMAFDEARGVPLRSSTTSGRRARRRPSGTSSTTARGTTRRARRPITIASSSTASAQRSGWRAASGARTRSPGTPGSPSIVAARATRSARRTTRSPSPSTPPNTYSRRPSTRGLPRWSPSLVRSAAGRPITGRRSTPSPSRSSACWSQPPDHINRGDRKVAQRNERGRRNVR